MLLLINVDMMPISEHGIYYQGQKLKIESPEISLNELAKKLNMPGLRMIATHHGNHRIVEDDEYKFPIIG